MNADADLQCKVCAQFLAERAAKVTDDPDQLTLMAYRSEESLVLVLRVRAALKKDRGNLDDFYAQQKAAAASPTGRA